MFARAYQFQYVGQIRGIRCYLNFKVIFYLQYSLSQRLSEHKKVRLSQNAFHKYNPDIHYYKSDY